jgi:hypothetical protein
LLKDDTALDKPRLFMWRPQVVPESVKDGEEEGKGGGGGERMKVARVWKKLEQLKVA